MKCLPLYALLLMPLTVLLSGIAEAKPDTNLTNRIDNPGFESNFNGWNDIDPSSISSIERSGSKAAKIDGSKGRVHQEIDVSTNRTYTVSVYIRGNGKLRVKSNGKNYTATRGNSSSYSKRSVTFNSGGDNDIDINLEYNGQTCRFDDVQLYEIGGSNSSPAPSGGSGELDPKSVTGTSGGSNGPSNAIDGKLSTRYSSNGLGKYLQLDLGSNKSVGSVDIAWFKGNQRSASFEVYVGTSTSNLSKVFTGSSSGSTLNLENYNTTNRTGRYVRIVNRGNTSNNWLSITEIRVFEPNASTAPPAAPAPAPPSSGGGGSGTASAIIGNGWKLNGFKGTLKVGNNDNNLDYADDASKSESHFFFEKNGYAAFRCYPGSPTSGGSSNPRSELREIIKGGDNFWNGNTSTERSMKWRVRIEDLPPSGKLCFAQIHEKDDHFDDVIRVQVEGSAGQNSGSVKLRILGFVTEELEGGGKTAGTISMDKEYYFELTMKNGVVRLYLLNNSGNRTNTLYTSKDVGNANENYFKAGCYLQSTKSSHSGSSTYGQVLIKNLTLKIDD